VFESWITHYKDLSYRKATLFSGCRKIIRNVSFEFDWDGTPVRLKDGGYTTNKMKLLHRQYFHEESRNVALGLWDKRVRMAKYGSVGFTTYAHFIKGSLHEAQRGSVFGPCIQSVVVTLVDKNNTAVDVFYRSTEFCKKFPADIVFVCQLLEPFKLVNPVVTFHFANITLHPMYCLLPMVPMEEPADFIHSIKKHDPFYWLWVVKWSARYLCDEYHHGIEKFDQAMKVSYDIRRRMSQQQLNEIAEYCRKHHPGMRKPYKPVPYDRKAPLVTR